MPLGQLFGSAPSSWRPIRPKFWADLLRIMGGHFSLLVGGCHKRLGPGAVRGALRAAAPAEPPRLAASPPGSRLVGLLVSRPRRFTKTRARDSARVPPCGHRSACRLWRCFSLGQILPLRGRVRQNLAGFGPTLAELGPTSANIGPILADSSNSDDFGLSLAEIVLILVNSGPIVGSLPLGRIQSKLGRNWPIPGPMWPNSSRFRAIVLVDCARFRAECGRATDRLGQFRANIGRLLAEVWLELGLNRPEFGPDSAKCGIFRPDSAPNLGNEWLASQVSTAGVVER